MNFRLSQKDFETIITTITIGDRPKRSAHLVIVDGLSLKTAAEQMNVSTEAIRKAVRRVETAWEQKGGSGIQLAKSAAEGMLKEELKNAGFPKDWVPVVAVLPETVARSVLRLEDEKLQQLGNASAVQ